MTSLLKTVEPKSDQLNADDLIGGTTKTIKVTKVSLLAGDQPVAVSYEGDNGKPYKPCKSMRRVLIYVWGDSAEAWVGKSMTLYCDPNVRFGADLVGGIRISHVSDIAQPMTIALTATKGKRKPYTVQPLVGSKTPSPETYLDAIEKAKDMDELKTAFSAASRVFKGTEHFDTIVATKDEVKDRLSAVPNA